jgi:siroheme synthase
VFLIGAETDDSELSTFTGQRCLCAADVVIYDRLISRELLREASPRAVLMYVGKESGQHSAQQEQINALVVEYARQGYLVVRLKDGDPFVFGRGGEEALALAKAGIAFEIVAGAGSA